MNKADTLLVVDDDPAVAAIVSVYSAGSSFRKVVSVETAAEGLAALGSRTVGLVILDLGLPDRPERDALQEFLAAAAGIPIAIVTADDRTETTVRCMREGAFDFLEKPLSPARLISLLAHAAEHNKLKQLTIDDDDPELQAAFSSIVTQSPLMKSLFKAVRRIATDALPVLISGESGTGKELFAKAIHDLSGRQGEFVAVNTAGLDGTMFSDVLFGHTKGAYTGAEGIRSGLVKQAAEGSLFLDEIGDISPETQVKLLRFLQNGEYYPLGSDKPQFSSSRIILATNVNLATAVQNGKFRADLYYRLMIHTITLPPLRDRKEDLPLLIRHFIGLAAKDLRTQAPIPRPDFMEALANYAFPGNIRELAGLIYGATANSATGYLEKTYLDAYLEAAKTTRESEQAIACPDTMNIQEGPLPSLAAVEAAYIEEALRRSRGKQAEAAQLLGISQSSISRYLKAKAAAPLD